MVVTLLTLFLQNPHIAAQDPSAPNVERFGAPTIYTPSVARYRDSYPNVNNAKFYPVPQDPISRETYMTWIEESGMLDYVDNPRRGEGGLPELLPALARYVQTGDAKYSDACIAMLKDCYRAMKEEVASKGWCEHFGDPAGLIPVYRRFLMQGGAMTGHEDWFRDLWLYYCRNLHVWNGPPVEWRGACHRSMPEGLAKGLAAKWYPDIPEAKHWKKYSMLVWGDFWKYKDLHQNDTGYMQDSTRVYAFASEDWFGDTRYLSDNAMQPLWKRVAAEISPDGAINPYGPNGGWNSTAALRVALLERLASATGNGEYRFAAHKAMQYLLYQQEPTFQDHYLTVRETGQFMALAYLSANDTIDAVEPYAGSSVSHRHETIRIPHTNKSVVGKYLEDIDPREGHGDLCCNTTFNGNVVPDKFIFRSGWEKGDLFAIVELCPTSFPYNPGGIMGINRWGAPFTQIGSSKGGTPENHLHIEAVNGDVPLRYIDDPHRISESWQTGKMEAISSEVEVFHDTQGATFARIAVQNPTGLPVRYIREFVFVKNGFIVSREIANFEAQFDARVSAIWNTQNIGPQIGTHWANTFMRAPVASNGQIEMRMPPVDMLVYFAPRPGWNIEVADRTEHDPRTYVTPAQIRYVWEGKARNGKSVHSTQVYYPHQPWRARPSTVDLGAKAVYDGGRIQATAGASAIETVIDTGEVTLLRMQFTEGHVQWILFNSTGQDVRHSHFSTDAKYAYISIKNGTIEKTDLLEDTYFDAK